MSKPAQTEAQPFTASDAERAAAVTAQVVEIRDEAGAVTRPRDPAADEFGGYPKGPGERMTTAEASAFAAGHTAVFGYGGAPKSRTRR
jgi:hypothetical protein